MLLYYIIVCMRVCVCALATLHCTSLETKVDALCDLRLFVVVTGL